jgi:hypothetical protein
MIITGIEVIRDNPRRKGIPRSDIERAMSHYGISEEEYLAHPECYPLPERGYGLEVAPPEKLELTYGDTLRITTGFNYRGPAHDITLYGAIGNRRGFPLYDFDEIIHAEATHKTPDSPTIFVPVTASVDIPITADIAPKPDYDIYTKIKGYLDAGLPGVDDVIAITGIPPTFELLEETIYPYAYIYAGDAEVSTFTFKSDPFTPSSWIAGRVAKALEEQVRKDGGKVLEMRVYADKSPLLWTDWRIEVVGIPPKTTGTAMPLGIAWWAVAILAALAIALIIVITWAIKAVVSLFKRKPGLDEVKIGWEKDTLIKTIQDSEEYWERTPTPIETLEEMSEEDLRHYLNKIAEEEVPPAEPGLGLAIAAVGVLGLGALGMMAMAMGRPEERARR